MFFWNPLLFRFLIIMTEAGGYISQHAGRSGIFPFSFFFFFLFFLFTYKESMAVKSPSWVAIVPMTPRLLKSLQKEEEKEEEKRKLIEDLGHEVEEPTVH